MYFLADKGLCLQLFDKDIWNAAPFHIHPSHESAPAVSNLLLSMEKEYWIFVSSMKGQLN